MLLPPMNANTSEAETLYIELCWSNKMINELFIWEKVLKKSSKQIFWIQQKNRIWKQTSGNSKFVEVCERYALSTQ